VGKTERDDEIVLKTDEGVREKLSTALPISPAGWIWKICR
jgi:hypothetical protein